jgi:hypothetical protein
MYDVRESRQVVKRVQRSSERRRIFGFVVSDLVIELFKCHMHPISELQ